MNYDWAYFRGTPIELWVLEGRGSIHIKFPLHALIQEELPEGTPNSYEHVYLKPEFHTDSQVFVLDQPYSNSIV